VIASDDNTLNFADIDLDRFDAVLVVANDIPG
jgi:hypothetical protein